MKEVSFIATVQVKYTAYALSLTVAMSSILLPCGLLSPDGRLFEQAFIVRGKTTVLQLALHMAICSCRLVISVLSPFCHHQCLFTTPLHLWQSVGSDKLNKHAVLT
jgi:hypothetical protein